jgi:mannose-6-phosphate isomerase-like protein (cupin superfamily)
MPVRRVVTGTAPDGTSVIAADDQLEPVTVAALPGYAWHRLWALDHPPSDPATPAAPVGLDHFPPPGGFRFNLFTVPPAGTARGPLTPATEAELARKLPGRAAQMESDQGGMHRTASVDLIVVLSGRISLELDRGVTVDLSSGDCLVQNGTRHAWRNNSAEPCTLGIVLIGAS